MSTSSSSTTSSTKAIAASTTIAVAVGGLYLFYKSLPTIMTTITKLQMNPLDEKLGSLIQEKGAPSYEEIKALGVIEGKSALVVGGTRGVGFGTALALAKSGASAITVVGRSEETGSKAVAKIVEDLDNDSKSSINFLQGDIGTVASTQELLKKLEASDIRYDYLVVTAAIFPKSKRKNPTPLNSDGIEKAFAIGVLGRLLLFRAAHTFMKKPAEDPSYSPMILNVMAAGTSIGFPFDRALVQSLHGFHLFNIGNFAVGNEILLHKLTTKEDGSKGGQNSDGTPFAIPIITTHPGFLKTDLHRGQGLLMDIGEAISVHFMGSTEEVCGQREVSLLCAVGEKYSFEKASLLTIVDNFGYGRLMNNDIKRDLNEHGDWLWDLLVFMESGGSIDNFEG